MQKVLKFTLKAVQTAVLTVLVILLLYVCINPHIPCNM